MLHGISINKGVVRYSNKYVETPRMADELAAGTCFVFYCLSKGHAIYPRLGAMRGVTGVIKIMLFHAQQKLGLLTSSAHRFVFSTTSDKEELVPETQT